MQFIVLFSCRLVACYTMPSGRDTRAHDFVQVRQCVRRLLIIINYPVNENTPKLGERLLRILVFCILYIYGFITASVRASARKVIE